MALETRGFEFGDFFLDTDQRVLLRLGKQVSLTPKTLDVLFELVENHGRIVEKADLMSKVWADSFVEDSNLTFTISLLRKALAADASQTQFIETIPKRGYRFVVPVTQIPNGGHLIADAETVPDGFLFSIGSRPILYLSLALFIGSILLTGFFIFRKKPTYYERFAGNGQKFLSVEKLTNPGNAEGVNISSDGKFFVYHTAEAGKDTIWLRLSATGKTIPIYSTADDAITSENFSENGEYIYFTHQQASGPLRLSRVSTLGGAPTLILSGLHSSWSISSDQSKIAYSRFDDQADRIMVADADGKNEQEVLASPRSRHFNSISWSPDGHSIAYCADQGIEGRSDYGLFELDLATKAETPLTTFKWAELINFIYLPDRSGMLVTARERRESPTQIWRLSLPDGLVDRITNDSSSLNLRGISDDFSKILAQQESAVSTIYVASKNNPSDAHPVAKAEYDVAWAPNGDLVYQNRDSLETDIWTARSDGSDKAQLTITDSAERAPVVTRDGRYIVFTSMLAGQPNLWRMDADGGNQIQLTNDGGEGFAALTPDGQFAVYSVAKDHSLHQVSIDGGPSQYLAEGKYRRVAISPDGNKLAHIEFVDGKAKLLIESFPECKPIRQFDTKIYEASFIPVRWSNDGAMLTYFANDSTTTGNLWQQSVAGGEPVQITNFPSDTIVDFDISPDESKIAVVRYAQTSNAVLLTGFQ